MMIGTRNGIPRVGCFLHYFNMRPLDIFGLLSDASIPRNEKIAINRQKIWRQTSMTLKEDWERTAYYRLNQRGPVDIIDVYLHIL